MSHRMCVSTHTVGGTTSACNTSKDKVGSLSAQCTDKVGSKAWLATWLPRLPCSPAKPQLVLQVWLAALRPAKPG